MQQWLDPRSMFGSRLPNSQEVPVQICTSHLVPVCVMGRTSFSYLNSHLLFQENPKPAALKTFLFRFRLKFYTQSQECKCKIFNPFHSIVQGKCVNTEEKGVNAYFKRKEVIELDLNKTRKNVSKWIWFSFFGQDFQITFGDTYCWSGARKKKKKIIF